MPRNDEQREKPTAGGWMMEEQQSRSKKRRNTKQTIENTFMKLVNVPCYFLTETIVDYSKRSQLHLKRV